jgi:hypothetical protein
MKMGFKRLKFDKGGESAPPPSGIVEGCPISGPEPRGEVKGCQAVVTEPKKGLVIFDLKSPGCEEIVKGIPDLPRGNRKYFSKHVRYDGKPLEDSKQA